MYNKKDTKYIHSAPLFHTMKQGFPHIYKSAAVSVQSLSVDIDAGTANDTSVPVYGLYDFSQWWGIYLQAEMGSGEKQIEAIELYFEGYTGGYTYNNQEIWLAHVSESSFDAAPAVNLSDLTITNLTECKGSFTNTISGAGYKTFTFDTNFRYNGTSNLLVMLKNIDGSWVPGYGNTHADSSKTNRNAEAYTDNAYPTGNGTRGNNWLVNCKFHY